MMNLISFTIFVTCLTGALLFADRKSIKTRLGHVRLNRGDRTGDRYVLFGAVLGAMTAAVFIGMLVEIVNYTLTILMK